MNKVFLQIFSTVTAAAIVGGAAALWKMNDKLADVRTDVAVIKAKLNITSDVARSR